MSDITLCSNKHCPSRDLCYRAQAKPGEMQSWCEFGFNLFGGTFCKMYIECRSKSQVKRLEKQTCSQQ